MLKLLCSRVFNEPLNFIARLSAVLIITTTAFKRFARREIAGGRDARRIKHPVVLHGHVRFGNLRRGILMHGDSGGFSTLSVVVRFWDSTDAQHCGELRKLSGKWTSTRVFPLTMVYDSSGVVEMTLVCQQLILVPSGFWVFLGKRRVLRVSTNFPS